MTNHTKCPWKFKNIPKELFNIQAGTSVHIPEYFIGSDDTRICRVNSELDAALIAAAPELLAALEHLERELGDEQTYVKHSKAAMQKIRDAIKKAKGN